MLILLEEIYLGQGVGQSPLGDKIPDYNIYINDGSNVIGDGSYLKDIQSIIDV